MFPDIFDLLVISFAIPFGILFILFIVFAIINLFKLFKRG